MKLWYGVCDIIILWFGVNDLIVVLRIFVK